MNSFILENKHYKTLNTLTLGYQKCEGLHSFGYAYTDFYLIHYVFSGCGTFYKNKKPLKISAGEMFIIKPSNVYSYIADRDNPWEYMWFSFEGEIASFFENIGDVVKADSRIFHEMLSAGNLKHTASEFVTGKIYELISLLSEPTERENNYVKKVSDFINANFAHKLTVEDIASAVNLNSRYLSRIFKKEKGVSIQEYIIKYKIEKAKKLLLKEFSVGEVSKNVGYDDPFTFSKIFKKYEGISPSAFSALKTKRC